MRARAAIAVAALLLAGLAWWALGGGPAPSAPEDDIGPVHVHGLGINPADGRLHIATHTGMWRLDDDGRPRRVGESLGDFMGFTVVGPDHFLASGHPDLRLDLPPLLGLIESRDGGRTWESRSLLGAADFHGLRARRDRIYGWSTDGTFMVSDDGMSWERRGGVALVDFAVDPDDPQRILGTTSTSLVEAQLTASRDGGRTWLELEGPAVERLAWPRRDRLFGITADGRVWRSRDGGAAWTEVGDVGGRAGALLDTGAVLYAALGEGIVHSLDDGRSWQVLGEAPR